LRTQTNSLEAEKTSETKAQLKRMARVFLERGTLEDGRKSQKKWKKEEKRKKKKMIMTMRRRRRRQSSQYVGLWGEALVRQRGSGEKKKNWSTLSADRAMSGETRFRLREGMIP